MSLHCMAMGTLVADPVRRTSQAGKPFVTASLRVACDGAEPFLASLIAFSTTAAERTSRAGPAATGRSSTGSGWWSSRS